MKSFMHWIFDWTVILKLITDYLNYYEQYLELSFCLCLWWLWTWTQYWHPMWDHCYRQDSKISSYSNPTLKSAKSTKLHKIAGGNVQTQIHQHFEGESVQEEGSPSSRNCEKADWPSTTLHYHSGDWNCDIRSNKLPGICVHLQCLQAVWTVKKWKLPKLVKNNIIEEIDSKSATKKKTHFWL